MTPTWLSPAVVSIMDGIDHDRAYDRLPVLADVLENANCDDQGLLSWLRDWFTVAHRYYRPAVEGHSTPEQVVDAMAWLTNLSAEVGDQYQAVDTFDGLLENMTAADNGDHYLVSYGADTPDVDTDKMWECYRTLTGPAKDPDRYPPSVFSCSC